MKRDHEKIMRYAALKGITLTLNQALELAAIRRDPPGYIRRRPPKALHPWLWRHRMERRRVASAPNTPRRHGGNGYGTSHEPRGTVDFEYLGDKAAAVTQVVDGRRLSAGCSESERACLLGPWVSLIERVAKPNQDCYTGRYEHD